MSVILGSDLMTVSAWMLAIFGGLAMVLMVLGDVAICLPHVYVMYTVSITIIQFIMELCNNHLALSVRGSTLDVRSDVCRRQILTPEINPRTVRIEIFIMAVDP